MDRRELGAELDTVVLEAMVGHQATLWTALPAIVQSYDPACGTVEAYPAMKFRQRLPDMSYAWVDPPLFVDCPVVFPSGGGFTLTFPLAAGDEVLVVFASRCIDSWWDASGVQQQAEVRMHDMSDGFAVPGPKSRPRVIASMHTDGVELRNDARTAYFRISSIGDVFVQTAENATVEAGGDVHVDAGADLIATAAGIASVTAPTINIVGDVNITGNVAITGQLATNGKRVDETHHHVPDSHGDTQGPVA